MLIVDSRFYTTAGWIRNRTMPSSRKRSKGKERKAKQVAKREENDRANEIIARATLHRYWRNLSDVHPVSGCDHGCNVMIPNNHPVS